MAQPFAAHGQQQPVAAVQQPSSRGAADRRPPQPCSGPWPLACPCRCPAHPPVAAPVLGHQLPLEAVHQGAGGALVVAAQQEHRPGQRQLPSGVEHERLQPPGGHGSESRGRATVDSQHALAWCPRVARVVAWPPALLLVWLATAAAGTHQAPRSTKSPLMTNALEGEGLPSTSNLQATGVWGGGCTAARERWPSAWPTWPPAAQTATPAPLCRLRQALAGTQQPEFRGCPAATAATAAPVQCRACSGAHMRQTSWYWPCVSPTTFTWPPVGGLTCSANKGTGWGSGGASAAAATAAAAAHRT